MSASPLVISILILSVILFFLVSFYIFTSRAKKKKALVVYEDPKIPTFDELKAKLKNKEATNAILRNTIDDIVELYGDIEEKTAGRPAKDFDRYMELIFIVCKHPNTDKRLVLDFERDLARLNPQYKRDLDNAVTKGLSFR